MVQFSSVLFAQIRFLVQNLYKKNAKNNIAEVHRHRHTGGGGGGVTERN